MNTAFTPSMAPTEEIKALFVVWMNAMQKQPPPSRFGGGWEPEENVRKRAIQYREVLAAKRAYLSALRAHRGYYVS